MHDKVLILDFGSQYTQLIARRVREQKVYCEIHPCLLTFEQIKAFQPKAIILSGGPASVLDAGSPTLDPRVLQLGVPVLGICYGMQIITKILGGKVEKSAHREFGRAHVTASEKNVLFSRMQNSPAQVWMSHGDRIAQVPEGFRIIATSENSPAAAMANADNSITAIQFHPEVVHTPEGAQLLASFLFDIAKLKADWTMTSFIEDQLKLIREKVGSSKVICGLSGGVDSSVAAVLIHQAIGDQLQCIFVDHGMLRKNEAEQVEKLFREHYHIPLKVVNASKRFLSALSGVTEPEQKRKIIGREFIAVFDQEAKSIQGVEFLAQGTLYPDVIESLSFKGPSATIKTHHNVGGLPEHMKLKLIEPFRELFKDEVRQVGRELGLPATLVDRHPFPGPGLAIRILGEITEDRLRVLREADAIFIEELHKHDYYHKTWQAFAVLLPVNSVGVMGDERTYENVCALRAVTSVDGMTADWAELPYELLAKASSRICNEVKGINRVVYDISSKPPATIEWE